MAKLKLCDLYKDFGEGYVVKNVNLEVNESEFCVLVGASGSGKSTILRMIAGLEKVTNGEVYLDGKLINNVPPGDRDMAMVFQNYALYAHMSVANNLGYSLKIRKVPKQDRINAIQAVAEKLQIEQLLNRRPKNLSGGERQRVALGRAIIRHPKVFLMDEPLSNLDALLRVQMRTEILRLQRELKTTTVYVTHDQVEAMSMADKLVLLRLGEIEQIGKPNEIYNHPANRYVASFVGTPVMNFIEPGELRYEDGEWQFVNIDLSLILPEHLQKGLTARNLNSDTKAVLGVRAEDISVGTPNQDWNKSQTIPGQIKLMQNLGSHTIAFTDIGHQLIAMSLDPSTEAKESDQVQILLDLRRIHLFDAQSGLAINQRVN